MKIAWFVAYTNVAIGGNEHVIDIFNIVMIWKISHCIFSILLSKGGGGRGKHLPLPVPLLQPTVPFCELSLASRLFSNDL